VHDERRDPHGREHGADIDLHVHARDGDGRARARGQPPVVRVPPPERLIVNLARGVRLDSDRAAPVALHGVDESFGLFLCTPPRVVRSPRPPREPAVQDQGDGPIRIGRREEHGHRGTLGISEQRGATRSHRIHHRSDVVHSLLEAGNCRTAIGQPRAALVEADESGKRSESMQHPSETRLLPLVLNMRYEARNHDEIERTGAHYLVGDVNIPTLGVPCLGYRAHAHLPGIIPICSVRPSADELQLNVSPIRAISPAFTARATEARAARQHMVAGAGVVTSLPTASTARAIVSHHHRAIEREPRQAVRHVWVAVTPPVATVRTSISRPQVLRRCRRIRSSAGRTACSRGQP
jgi:hypothetical protein